MRIYFDVFPKSRIRDNESRLWKIDPDFDVKKAWQKWEPADKLFRVDGKILDENQIIEVCE